MVYGDGDGRRRRPRDPPRATRASTPAVLDGGWPAWAADAGEPRRASSSTTSGSCTSAGCATCSPAAGRGPAERRRAAVPRELRCARGIRGRPHPGRALPRHELARDAGRLEPPVARRARRTRCGRSASPPTRRSSSTAGTRRAAPTRSGRAAGPARSPRRGPRLILRYAGVARRPPPRRRLRLVGPRRQPARDRRRARRARSPEFGVADPAASGAHRRPRRGEGDPRRPGRRGARERPHLEGAHRQGQRLQLHPARRPDPRRRLGQLRHRRVPHAALPQRGQHDARLPRDRGQLGRGRDHARQVGRLLLRHRLARQRDVVLRRPAGLGPDRRLRRRLVRVERRPARTTRSTSATRRPRRSPPEHRRPSRRWAGARRRTVPRHASGCQNDPMGPDERGPRGPQSLRTTRMEAFSDGVFAIAITLLVLEIAVPAARPATCCGPSSTSGRPTWPIS